MYFIILLILFLLFFEGFFLYTKKQWKELSLIGIILSLSLYFTLAHHHIVPDIDFPGTLEALFRPITDLVGEF